MRVHRVQEDPHCVYLCRGDPLNPSKASSPGSTEHYVATSDGPSPEGPALAFAFLYQELCRTKGSQQNLEEKSIPLQEWQQKFSQMFGGEMPLDPKFFEPSGRYKLFTDEISAKMCPNLTFHTLLVHRPSPPATPTLEVPVPSAGDRHHRASLYPPPEETPRSGSCLGPIPPSVIPPGGLKSVGSPQVSPSSHALYRTQHQELDALERTTLMVKLQQALQAAEVDRATYEQEYTREKTAVKVLEMKFATIVEKNRADQAVLVAKVRELETSVALHQAEKKHWERREQDMAKEIEGLKSQLAQQEVRGAKDAREAQDLLKACQVELEHMRATSLLKERDITFLVEANARQQTESRAEVEKRTAEVKREMEEALTKLRREHEYQLGLVMEEKLDLIDEMRRLKCELISAKRHETQQTRVIAELRKGLLGISDDHVPLSK